MTTICLEIIKQLNSSVFILIAVLVVLFWIIFHIGRWKEKFFTHDDKMKSLDIVKEKVTRLEAKIDLIYMNTNPRALISAGSPLMLTQRGIEISQRIKAKDIFEKYKTRLIDEVEKKCSQNAYDIQQE